MGALLRFFDDEDFPFVSSPLCDAGAGVGELHGRRRSAASVLSARVSSAGKCECGLSRLLYR